MTIEARQRGEHPDPRSTRRRRAMAAAAAVVVGLVSYGAIVLPGASAGRAEIGIGSEPAAAAAPADHIVRQHDPFSDLTDAEIDALSDDEFAELIERWLDNEGGAVDDGDWEDEGGDGEWADSDWEDGDWEDGEWEDGEWEDDGYWDDDGWDDDGWADGEWADGEWADGYWDDDGWDDGDWDDHGDHTDHAAAGEPEPLATVDVDGDQIDTVGLTPAVAEDAQAIWDRFAKLIPADQRQMVARFELMPTSYDGAHVYPTDEDPTRWVLGVGAGLLSDEAAGEDGVDLDYVLIHEFAHLLTLNAGQVPPATDDGSDCQTYFTGEGCALRTSTINRFVATFWPAEMLEEIARIQESGDEEAMEAFYRENEDRFVTDYATTNPAEDLAETFAVFVTRERPTGTTVADQKVELLWNDPAMVDLRAKIRANL